MELVVIAFHHDAARRPDSSRGTVRSNEQEVAMLEPRTEDLRFAGLEALAERLAAGEVTSTRLTTDALAWIEATQPKLNAFRRVRADAAMAEAAEADRRLRLMVAPPTTQASRPLHTAGRRAPLL
ncbi:MAG TPA: hypothetical protein VGX25_10315, partial [Actinophytocola sp.]|nr:hypothetical protein [Actinophytocola sp.]